LSLVTYNFTYIKTPEAIASGVYSLAKHIFAKLAEVKGAAETSNSRSLAYSGTVECELRRKSKCLAQQAAFAHTS